ncbi:hypothetical protein NF556_05655 [Ornithinimicrobium faecis]|uniref:Uncharacterized protein n=1 Tax=Ornithinimicrobium faecis TaxID=2934158 RepID=A0ABY4YWK9_9MICO|nr:hypothetical protein [Ornithinimicrobium sp. HY1793]USQ81130.1 hypothetical protein NF556_05655 [Ornithinimicrobium sp. HY1793]
MSRNVLRGATMVAVALGVAVLNWDAGTFMPSGPATHTFLVIYVLGGLLLAVAMLGDGTRADQGPALFAAAAASGLVGGAAVVATDWSGAANSGAYGALWVAVPLVAAGVLWCARIVRANRSLSHTGDVKSRSGASAQG